LLFFFNKDYYFFYFFYFWVFILIKNYISYGYFFFLTKIPISMSSATPVYNFIELELEEYEENEMVLDVIHDLITFFKDFMNCTYRRSSNKRDLRTCFEKVRFKRFFERHLELKH